MTSCKTIAVFNNKGGVGKTATAVNLAASIVVGHAKRVLVIDMDPQANATRALLGREVGSDSPSIRDVLLQEPTRPVRLRDVVHLTSLSGLTVVPADLSLSEAEFKLVSRTDRELILANALHSVRDSHDLVFLDCPPSVGLLSLNALAAADGVIIPCETQFLSQRGLRYALDLVKLVQARLNPALRVLGVLATRFHVLSIANNEVLNHLRTLKGVHVFEAVIPRDIRLEEAPSQGKPLIQFAPDCRASRQFLLLADEVIRLCRD